MTKNTVIYTDGACSGNPGPGGWAYIYLSDGQVHEAGGAAKPTTNNRMEIEAVIQSLEFHLENNPKKIIELYSDSTLLINACTKWLKNWIKNNWIKSDGAPVINQDLWQRLVPLLGKVKINFHHIRGHSGDFHNERADDIAVAYSKSGNIKLYHGPQSDYESFVDAVEEVDESTVKKSEVSFNGKLSFPCYVSFLDGKIESYASWGECEKAVKGVSGIKFKKVKNQSQFDDFLKTLS